MGGANLVWVEHIWSGWSKFAVGGVDVGRTVWRVADNLEKTLLLRGGGPFFFCWNVKNFFLLHCVPLYVCRLCINYQDLRTNLLRMAALRILLLTFISHFVIDFLSI